MVPSSSSYPAMNNLGLLKWGVALAGFFTVAQFSFWGELSSALYTLHIFEAPGESFAANVGGRMVGTSAAFVTTQLANVTPGANPSAKLADAAVSSRLRCMRSVSLQASRCPNPKRKLFQSDDDRIHSVCHESYRADSVICICGLFSSGRACRSGREVKNGVGAIAKNP